VSPEDGKIVDLDHLGTSEEAGGEAPEGASEVVSEVASEAAEAAGSAVAEPETAPDDAAAADGGPAEETAAEETVTGEASAEQAVAEEASTDDAPTDEGLVAMDRALPDVTDAAALESALEALLLVVDSPASEESLAEAVDQPVARVTEALRTMSARLTERGSGIDLRQVGEGWRFFTRDTYAPFVEKLLMDGQRSKLTRAALETLAVIAYRQPVTRSRVAAVRGVNVDGVIRTLLARGLIEESGTDPETGGTLYVTTELFLERLGLASLNDLPPIAPLLPEVDAIDDI